jgi:spermidine/putrescine transport system ATP-binding protein
MPGTSDPKPDTIRAEHALSQPKEAIVIESVSKRFGDQLAVNDVSLTIREGEFFSLLGPSGCGKTTLLRMLAGFLEPDAGRITLRGDDVTHRPPNKRPVNMVFQHYELFPHMTVFANVAYGLRLKKVPKREIGERVGEMLGILGCEALAERRASQLSGGQQQRVALARALVNRPAVLLLDEPLSALDVKLRKRAQLELKSIQNELGTTFVYVTHDQEEAFLMSDRVGVMRDGVLLQVDSPREIYDHPADAFVADFVGTLNDLTVTVTHTASGIARAVLAHNGVLHVADSDAKAGQVVRVAVRPERIAVEPAASASAAGNEESTARGVITAIDFVGSITRYVVRVEGLGDLVVHALSDPGVQASRPGEDVVARWPLDASIVLSSEAPN